MITNLIFLDILFEFLVTHLHYRVPMFPMMENYLSNSESEKIYIIYALLVVFSLPQIRPMNERQRVFCAVYLVNPLNTDWML